MGIATSFFAKAAEVNRSPWSLAAGFYFAYPQTRGERPPDLAHTAQYFAEIETFPLLRPLSALQEEPLRSHMLAGLRTKQSPA